MSACRCLFGAAANRTIRTSYRAVDITQCCVNYQSVLLCCVVLCVVPTTNERSLIVYAMATEN